MTAKSDVVSQKGSRNRQENIREKKKTKNAGWMLAYRVLILGHYIANVPCSSKTVNEKKNSLSSTSKEVNDKKNYPSIHIKLLSNQKLNFKK